MLEVRARRGGPGPGSAIHSWTPCRSGEWSGGLSSEWEMPWPAVIRFSWPGRTSCRLPTLSRCSTSPGDQPADRLQPGVRVRRHLHAGRAADVVGPVVVDEAPGADHPPRPVGQRPGDRHRPRSTERDRSAVQQLAHRLDRHGRSPATRRLLRATFQVAHLCAFPADATGRLTYPLEHRREALSAADAHGLQAVMHLAALHLPGRRPQDSCSPGQVSRCPSWTAIQWTSSSLVPLRGGEDDVEAGPRPRPVDLTAVGGGRAGVLSARSP